LLLSIAGYTLLVLVTGNFIVHIPVSSLIKDSFGDDRIGWVFVGLLGDIGARYYRLFF
jgi:hypothetical protein